MWLAQRRAGGCCERRAPRCVRRLQTLPHSIINNQQTNKQNNEKKNLVFVFVVLLPPASLPCTQQDPAPDT
jgi:hypothetical protein